MRHARNDGQHTTGQGRDEKLRGGCLTEGRTEGINSPTRSSWRLTMPRQRVAVQRVGGGGVDKTHQCCAKNNGVPPGIGCVGGCTCSCSGCRVLRYIAQHLCDVARPRRARHPVPRRGARLCAAVRARRCACGDDEGCGWLCGRVKQLGLVGTDIRVSAVRITLELAGVCSGIHGAANDVESLLVCGIHTF